MTWTRLLTLLALAGCIFGVTACTNTVPLRPTFEPRAAGARLPLTIGLSFTQDFSSYTYSAKAPLPALGPRAEFVFPLGEASVALFQQLLPLMFERAIPISSPRAMPEVSLAAIIEMKIEEFHFQFPLSPFSIGDYRAELTYRFSLRSADGEPLGSWTVKGVGETPLQLTLASFDSRTPTAGTAAERAIQDAAMKFVGGFREVPEVRAWLRTLKVDGQ
ncbi:MAG TPA: hypothetical protein VKD71_06515 [Gemmataceae bacterium]|nr:hypothetical protein [Gemmataceae bacterium]